MYRKYKDYRNPQMIDYFNSLDYNLYYDLNETYHEVRYFDDFLDSLDEILTEHEDEIYFYTGWNYQPIKEMINGKTKKYGVCTQVNDETKHIPIYIHLYERNDKTYTAVNRKSEKIILYINMFNLDIGFLKFELQHELTHVVTDYSEERFANLNNLKHTISYDENIFGLEIERFDTIMRMLYWINKSEQEARIGATLKYVREKRQQRNEKILNYDQIVNYIKETDFLNQNSLFQEDKSKWNLLSESEVYILGYYMQMHHYMFNRSLYIENVRKAIDTYMFDMNVLREIQHMYYQYCGQFEKKLYHFIERQVIN